MRKIGWIAYALALAACQPKDDAMRQTPAEAEQTGREIAFIANAESGTVLLLDVAARAIVRTIDVNPLKAVVDRPGAPNYAQDTDVSSDGRTLYVSRGYLGDVAAFDIASGRTLWTSPLNTVRADHMTLSPDGAYLFVSALTDNKVYRLNARTGEINGAFVTGVYPHDNQMTKDGRRVINSSIGDMGAPLAERDDVAPSETSGYAYQLTIADIDTLRVLHEIRMPAGVRPWRMAPDETRLYAQVSNAHAVIAFSFPSGTELRRLDLPVKEGVSDADWDFEAPHHGLAISDDGSTLCLSGRASDYAALVSAPDLQLIAAIPVGDAPGWAELADDDRLCLLANARSDDVSIILVPERAELARIKAGDGPKHITIADVPVDALAAPGSP